MYIYIYIYRSEAVSHALHHYIQNTKTLGILKFQVSFTNLVKHL